MSYNAFGCEFNVNESTIWYIQKKEEKIITNLYIRLLQKVLKVTFIAHDEATEKNRKVTAFVSS